MEIFVSWLIYSLAILVSAKILPGIVVESWGTAFVIALVLGILNALLRPILIIFTLPINILTLGLFSLVINALMVLLASSIVKGFHVGGFWWAFLFAIILSIVNSVLYSIIKK